jgi:hypothetical protein
MSISTTLLHMKVACSYAGSHKWLHFLPKMTGSDSLPSNHVQPHYVPTLSLHGHWNPFARAVLLSFVGHFNAFASHDALAKTPLPPLIYLRITQLLFL